MAERLRLYQSLRWAGFVALALFGAAFIAISLTLVSASNRTSSLSVRNDCKTRYQSILDGPVRARDDLTADVASLNASLDSQLGSALLQAQSGVKATPATVYVYEVTKAALDEKRAALATAVAMVTAEPSFNRATTRGFTLYGVRYPACPSAS